MEYTVAILSNLVTLGIAILGVAFTVLFYKLDTRNKRNRKTINKLANQIKAYYELEQLYMKDVASTHNTSPLTVQKQYRAKVQNFSGRWLSSNDAEKYIRY